MTAPDDASLRVLQLIDKRPDLTQRQLAEALGVSVGKAHYLLRALMSKGAVKVRNFRHSQNKLGYAYLLTPQGLIEKATLTQRYLERKEAEYEALRKEIRVLRREVEVRA
jgi:hypothetical protein